jgi:hypothetical protein
MKKLLCFIFLFSQFHFICQSQLFALADNRGLYLLNLNNCSSIFLGNTGKAFEDIALTPNGRLWGLEKGALYEINTSAASVSLVAQLFPLSYNCKSLVEWNDTLLLTTSDDQLSPSGRVLYVINTNSGTSYSTGVIGYQTAGDLTWYDNNLYLTSNKLVKITLNANLSISNVQVNGANNIPPYYGCTTATLSGANNYIAGSTPYGGIDKICPIDGSYSVLCPSLTLNTFYGLASLRLPPQQPIPTSCSMVPNGFKNLISQGSKIEVSPNPVSKEESLYVKLIDNNHGLVNIKLLSMQGEVLFSFIETSEGNGIKLELKNLDLLPGVYLVTASSATSNLHSLVIIE